MNSEIERSIQLMVECIQKGNKVLSFGVGGNSANSIHFSSELAGKFEGYTDPLPCIDLSSNPSIISAIATDFGWDEVFSRQIEGIAKPGDVVVGFTISGKGEYFRKALSTALQKKCSIIVISGRDSDIESASNICSIKIEDTYTPGVQESQLILIHRLCEGVKSRLAKR